MTGRGGKKRHSSQPLGGAAKDLRGENGAGEGTEDGQEDELAQATRTGDMQTWSQVTSGGGGRGRGLQTANRFGLLAQASSYPDKSMRSSSICSRGSRGSARGRENVGQSASQVQSQRTHRVSESTRPSDLGENTRFVTPAPDGALRDEIVIECRTINDRPFKGTITFKEAREFMFHEVMGFHLGDLYSVRFRFSGCPVVRLKLKHQINLDDLMSVEYFNLERPAPNNRDTDLIACRIMGIRGAQSIPHYDGSENDIRWVKIEGCEYQLTEDQIAQGLAPFGELLTPIREDIFDYSDSEGELVGNGTNSVKMKLTKPVPQFLPMHGRKIRIYHNGINKLCSNCFGQHTRRQCRNPKKLWIEYVRDFMVEHPQLGEEYFGRWWDVVDVEYPGYFEDPEQRQDSQPEMRTENIPSIAGPQRTLPRINRDPRLNRNTTAGPSKEQTSSQSNPNQRQTIDRQTEMSRLLANGLTLTDARKYLTSMEEMETLNMRMQQNNTGDRFSYLDEDSQGQQQRHQQQSQQHRGAEQRSERGAYRGRGLGSNKQQW